jgi:hypothetical protein
VLCQLAQDSFVEGGEHATIVSSAAPFNAGRASIVRR